MLGYTTLGNGPQKVIFLHDWFNDHHSYDLIRPYLNTAEYAYIFIDLRGYGLSRKLMGECSVHEAAQDVLEVISSLSKEPVHAVCHSMTGMILTMAVNLNPSLFKTITFTCPVIPQGNPIPEDVNLHLRRAATKEYDSACEIINFMTGNRYSRGFTTHMVDNWYACSLPQARVGYLDMFTETNITHNIAKLTIPTLMCAGCYDAPAYELSTLETGFHDFFPQAVYKELPCGHYPMIEVPACYERVLIDFWKTY